MTDPHPTPTRKAHPTVTSQTTPPPGADLHLGGQAYAHPSLEPRLVPITEVTPYPGNPRRGDQDAITSSIRELGMYAGVVVQRSTGHILVGNHRRHALVDLGATVIPVDYLDVDDTRAAAIVARDNRTSDLGGYDDADLLALLTSDDDVLALSGYDDDDLDVIRLSLEPATYTPPVQAPSLADRFVVPPFTVLDQRAGAWQERKRRWLALGIKSEVGRGHDGMGGHMGTGPDGVSLRADPNQYAKREKAKRKGLGATQTNLDGEDAARYGRKDTRRVDPRTYTNTEGLARIKPGLKGALTGERTLGQGLQAKRDPVSGELVYEPMASTAGVSIFDPVLTELAYRWFSPLGGTVLDPFAGGSVRGIVASALGRSYVGVELRAEQVAANEAQADTIVPRLRGAAGPQPEGVQVKVSAASARQEFHGCEPDYIRDVCKGRCCRSPSASTGTGTMITIHPSEQAAIEAEGGTVIGGLLQPRDGEKRCPFQGQEGGDAEGLCGLHGTDTKPFGCIASPFTLNDNGTLIVRNRYRMLGCYKDTREDGTQLPAYVAFRASLDLIFGEAEAQRIADHLAAGGGDLTATMPARSHQMLVDNDGIKHGQQPTTRKVTAPRPVWHTGDSLEVLPTLDTDADLVFSCPPYADLEVYSDDPADLSNMPYDRFLEAYRAIIAASVDRLRDDRFAVWVIGEVRDRRGLYRGLVPDTIRAFQDAGAALYNEAVLVTPVGSLPIRTGRQFSTGRKMGKTHQTVLVFVKGDPRAAADACGTVEVSMPDTDDLAD